MFIGEVLSGKTSGQAHYFSEWFPRRGNRARFTFNLVETDNLTELKVAIQTKNVEQSDDERVYATGGTNHPMTLSADSILSFTAGAALGDTSDAGLLELVRVQYIVTGHGFGHIRALDPQWFTN